MGGELSKGETLNPRSNRGGRFAPTGEKNGKMSRTTNLAHDNHQQNTSPKRVKNKEKVVRKKEKIAIVSKNKAIEGENEELKVLE